MILTILNSDFALMPAIKVGFNSTYGLRDVLWKNLVFKTNYRLMQVESIAECAKGSILQYFWPSLSYHVSFRSLFCLFLSGRFTQVYWIKIEHLLRRSLEYWCALSRGVTIVNVWTEYVFIYCFLFVCLIWFFTSTQQSFSYAGRVFLGWTSTKLG